MIFKMTTITKVYAEDQPTTRDSINADCLYVSTVYLW